ncbi:hypothetical protein [Acidithiobacillus ferrivorans]|uniref:Uncharacterized protein n=1 Tax=Acidithiobacillus ferrivorans TaxID=160808 RepID=A0A7T4WCV3_9PROT|nr:hypothetical protein [Acidithiobacillus ferrivorans]QQD72298.1 hypothetical protein H2515_12960 [Acidithiobacillus ferrivorans]
MAALTKESLERLLLSGRITPKRTTAIRRPSSLAAPDGSRDRYQYHEDALEALRNDALTRAQLDYLQRQAALRATRIYKEVSKLNLEAVLSRSPKKASAGRLGRRAGDGTRSSAKSGDGNDDGDSDPDPERRPSSSFHLYDQSALAALLCISKHTLQNLYSKTPHLLPKAISIPGARGPRWTPESVQEWLNNRPKHTSTPAPVAAPKRKAGRPRIALTAVKGGAQ